METSSQFINAGISASPHPTNIDRVVTGLSLQALRTVIPLAVLYYVVPFLVDGYIYETRLRSFMQNIQALRDIVESRIGEERIESMAGKLNDLTQQFDRTFRWIEKRYTEKGPDTAKSQGDVVELQPVQLMILPKALKPIPSEIRSENHTVIQLPDVDREELVWASKRWIGTPYTWGGTAMWDGTDCSGFTQGVYRTFGVDLPRTAREQFDRGLYVPRNYLQPGDLVFFTTARPGVSHVGIYTGDDQFIHASSGTGWVTINNLHEPYFAKRYVGARRIVS